jgi:glyoxylase-like metal-dependent hydrolase (beta-lactamase superfamily II)
MASYTDGVVCTHPNIPHSGARVGADDKPLFPNAQVYISQADYDFWTDEGKLGSGLKDFVLHARKNLMPVKDRLVFIKDGQEFLPCIQAISAPGHTVGHTIFMVTSKGKSFAFLGDLSHHSVLLMEKPRMEFSYDTDPKQSAATRVRLLDMLAANRIPVMAYHFAWPGYGQGRPGGRGTEQGIDAREGPEAVLDGKGRGASGGQGPGPPHQSPPKRGGPRAADRKKRRRGSGFPLARE